MQPLLARWRLPRRLRSAISRPLVLGDHALKLDQQALFGAVAARRFEEQGLGAAPAEFFDQQHLVGIVTAQPIGRIDQDGLHQALGR
jgi:hypothetical protein